jgi:hypothetical protein
LGNALRCAQQACIVHGHACNFCHRDAPQLTRLATFSDHPNPNVTRILFTPNDMLGRE